MSGKFLSAEWRKLVIFNFEVDPLSLRSYLPAFTELDEFQNKHYVSLVGFHFVNTKIWGVKWPLHTNFIEVNLRFYVRRLVDNKWRRGVVFIREIVSKRIVTFIANKIYKENYMSAGLSANIVERSNDLSVKYAVHKKGAHIFGVEASADHSAFSAGSKEEFITEHYFGYSKATGNKTVEYGVEHPGWRCYPVKNYFLNLNFETVYGSKFSFLDNKKPASVFLAEGSEIIVRKPCIIQ
jgi:uncharacterized protein